MLVWRAVDLQINHKEFLENQGKARHLRVVTIPANRGTILDRNGEPLAVSTPVESVWANPQELAGGRQDWPKLARLLGVDADRLHRLIAERMDREFVYLKRHVDPDVAAGALAVGLPGVYLQREYRRYYPAGEVAAHLVGFTDVDDGGQEGMELAFDDWLRGVPGSKRVVRDRLGRIVEDVESIQPARPGKALTISVDRRIQFLAYRNLLAAVQRHGAEAGSLVVLDVLSGDVLAMVNQPSYNPNNRKDRVSARYRNRAVTDVFEPGSTLKPFTVAAALESGRFTPHSTLDTTPGYLRVGRHTVRDHLNYGVIDLATVIKKSSNVGASRLALSLQPKKLWEMLTRVGFGQTTGSGFPGESPGILTHHRYWSEIQRATIAFGYGISVTPLQLAQAYAVLANDGLLRPVRYYPDERAAEAQRVMSRRAAWQLRRMLETVTEAGGTGVRARVAGYRVAGKTGTVHKSTAGGYAQDRYLAVFAGMAPASRPRLVVVVAIDEPKGKEYYGGHIAAPVFAEVMAGALRLLGVGPDDPEVMAGVVSLSARHVALKSNPSRQFGFPGGLPE